MAVLVVVAPTTLTVNVGLNKTVVATVTGSGNTAVTWSTSDATKATVNSSGVVHGVAAGACNITATSVADGTKTAVCAVTVVAAVSVSVLPTSVNVNASATTTIAPTVTVTGSGVSQAVTWSTADATKAIVSSTGVVTGVSAGAVNITATSVADPSKSATCTVTVVLVVSVTSGTAVSILPGDKQQITAQVIGFNSDQVLIYTLTSGSGTVSVSGLYEAGIEGTDVVQVKSHANTSITVNVTYTVASAAGSAHKVHLADRENIYAQGVLQDRFNSLVPGSAEAVLCASALVNLRKYGF